jgi:peptide/nickel transport system permease protein
MASDARKEDSAAPVGGAAAPASPGAHETMAPTPGWWDYLRAVLTDKTLLPSLIVVLIMAAAAIAPSLLAPHDPYAQSLALRNEPPGTPDPNGGLPFFLGTDPLGRDVLSRLIHGARISLAVGLSVVVISGSIGVFLGMIAGFYRGWLSNLIMRIVDLQMSFPSLLLALFILFVAGPGFWNVVLVLAITRWMVFARVTRSVVLSIREQGYIEASRALGCSNRRILFRHVLPNMLPPIVVLATIEVSLAILAEGGLDFLGLGIQPPESSWGLMLAQGQSYITSAWWLVTFPGLAILATCLSFNLLASGVRELMDPLSAGRWIKPRKARAVPGADPARRPTSSSA